MGNTILKIKNLSKSFFTLDGEIKVLVDLPQPLGPTIAIISPFSTAKLMFFNTSNSPISVTYVFDILFFISFFGTNDLLVEKDSGK